MEKEKFLQSIKETLEAAGFLVDDLVQYCAEKEVPAINAVASDVSVVGVSSKENEERFPFEVMYEGMVRSWVPLEGKKPLGVIFENHLITLHDSSRTVPWREVVKYCREIKIEGHACSAGKIGFWKKVMSSCEEQKKALDNLLISLGGDTIVVQGKWYWSSSEYDGYHAWVFCTLIGADWGGVDYRNKYGNYVVHPVLDLSEFS